VGRDTNRIARQTPESDLSTNSPTTRQPVYFLNSTVPPADAILLESGRGDEVTLWLGGVHPDNLPGFDGGGALSFVDAKGKPQGQVQIIPRSREGLRIRGKLKTTSRALLTSGAILQTELLGIPASDELKLRIGLDRSLEPDLAAVETALGRISFIQAVRVQQGQETDYLLGRMTPTNATTIQASLTARRRKGAVATLPPIGALCLFTPGLEEVIPVSWKGEGAAQETLDQAIERLRPKFKSLLAARLARLILNPNASRLDVTASLTRADNSQAYVAQAFTPRGKRGAPAPPAPPPNLEAAKLPLETYIQLQVTNHEPDQDLYVIPKQKITTTHKAERWV
jgi:hypothetical protein